MSEINNSPNCERASDLVAFLYNEASEHERRDFESHLNECGVCRDEVASFGVVRESITNWRDEVLSGFVSTPLPSQANKKSALAAFRQFFDLSPLWLKGATAFAVLALFALATVALFKLQTNDKQIASTEAKETTVYTAQEVDRMVKEALAKQQQQVAPTPVVPDNADIKETPKRKVVKATSQMARRPLSRAEREQLAADLRLLTTRDDVDLQLLGDRINQ